MGRGVGGVEIGGDEGCDDKGRRPAALLSRSPDSIRLTPAISFFAVGPGSPHPSTIFRQPPLHLPDAISPHSSINQMSALAARRAALAAKAVIAAEAPAAPSKPATRSTKPAKQAPKPPPSPTLSDFSGVSNESDDSAGPSNKRRKVTGKGKKAPEKKEKEARYFVGVEIPTRAKPPAQKPRKQRAFSPSAAMDDMEDGTSEESSGEEEAEPVQDEAAALWSGAPSPWEPRAPR